MIKRYELHYRTKLGSIVYCGDFDDFPSANAEKQALSVEFPEHEYWIDEYLSDKEY